MRPTVRALLVAILLVFFPASGVALADITDSDATNLQEGDNGSDTAQSGASASGDAVGGQVTGIVSSGDTSIDARNRSEDADIETGAADGTNNASSFTGLSLADNSTVTATAADIEESCTDAVTGCFNAQEGDNDTSLTQTASATSGDGVGGQVIGAVTSAGGSADIVADNSSDDVDIDTGDAVANNASAAFTGLSVVDEELNVVADAPASDISDSCRDAAVGCYNAQDGENETTVDQSAGAASGDGVAGQVIGSVSAGDTSIDARNRSEDADVETGGAASENSSAALTGLSYGTAANVANGVEVEDIEESCREGAEGCFNAQDGDNGADVAQTADAASGDGVAGQVIGSVTSAGGSAEIVADNGSEDADVDTGDAAADNDAAGYIGLNVAEEFDVILLSDVTDSCRDSAAVNTGCWNAQDGDNEGSTSQTADSASGDGVAGQVIGSVSAGDASIDARNRSEDVGVDTGDSLAHNDAPLFVGLNASDETTIENEVGGADIEGSCDFGIEGCFNAQDGDNEASIDQSADATTGDGVAGQVVGAVTSAGGSADIVADNASEDADAGSGDATAQNQAAAFVGLDFTDGEFEIESGASTEDITDSCDEVFELGCINVQDGDNELGGSQTASAASGDGVAGQVLGVVSAGDASVDARNRSEDVDAATGEADALNTATVFVGLNASESVTIDAADIEGAEGFNLLDGDNDGNFDQTADASSGDAVAGQVTGVVTSAGGSADAVLDNASEDIDAETGESTFDDTLELFVGLNVAESDLTVG